LARLGKFPKPVKLSAGITAWRLEEIEAWELEKCRKTSSVADGKA
jgi:predicted DNA-binding transcriptional regulator AlpA